MDSGMIEKPKPAKNSEPPPPLRASIRVRADRRMPTGARIHAQAKPKPLRKRNHTPSGGKIIDGRPIATHFQLVRRRGWRRPSSSVPRIALTMLIELTCIDDTTTVM